MSDTQYCDKVSDFLDLVCGQIKAKEIHSEIRAGLESHLNDVIEQKIKEGVHKEEAMQQAIRQMGDPILLGKQMHKVHKPKMEWGLIGLVAVFLSIGLTATYAISQGQFFSGKIMYTCIGTVLMLFLWFFDYRKFTYFSWYLYMLTLLVMVYTIIIGSLRDGKLMLNLGGKIIDFISITPYLFIIALAGIMVSNRWKKQSILEKFIIFILVPVYLYIESDVTFPLLTYFLSFMILLVFSKRSWKEFVCLITPVIVFFLVFVLGSPYRTYILLHPYDHHPDRNLQSLETIRFAGMWGHGFKSPFIKSFFNIQSDMIFTYVIHSFGWFMGIVIFVSSVFFVFRIMGVARMVGDVYGKLIVIGILTVFSAQFFSHILMSIGLVPWTGIPLPFISNYSGVQFIVQLAAIGMILSIYRRKDIIKNN